MPSDNWWIAFRVCRVARVRVSGGNRYALRVWVDREALAARRLTVNDIEDALRRENVDPPAGAVQSLDRQFTVRINREYQTPEDFEKLVIAGARMAIRCGWARWRIELGSSEGSGDVSWQSRAHDLAGHRAPVTRQHAGCGSLGARGGGKVRPTLPPGMSLENSYDLSVFVEESLHEVYRTLVIAILSGDRDHLSVPGQHAGRAGADRGGAGLGDGDLPRAGCAGLLDQHADHARARAGHRSSGG
jgi:multidrug efflux pump